MSSEKIIVLYERLSREDENLGESYSISNQKKLLEDYCREKGWTRFRHFTDDGISGTTFNRPAFNSLLTEIEAGRVGTVIVKDMSRFGRNYLQVGFYTEMMFPKKNVRFIAVNNGVDSANPADNDFTPFLNIMNEWYAKDTSKKIKAVFKAKMRDGKRVSGAVPYGYYRKPEDKQTLYVDEASASVVRRIFQLACDGMGATAIADTLSEDKILIPSAYARQNHPEDCQCTNYHDPYTWNATTVGYILNRREYLGHTVLGKTTRDNFKTKRKRIANEDELLVFYNTHEAIIDQETYDKAQRMRKRVSPRRNSEKPAHRLSGLLYCADCGSRLAYINSKPKDGKIYDSNQAFRCSRYHNKYHSCTGHYIKASTIEMLIYQATKRVSQYVLKDEKEFVEQLKAQYELQCEKVSAEFFDEFNKRYGSHIHILDWALHLDEATPHIHERHVFDAKNKYGELCPQQDKALEELGFELPDPAKKKGKYNNRKMNFDAECRKLFLEIAQRNGVQVECEPVYGGAGYLEKQDFIIENQKKRIAEKQAVLDEITMRVLDMENFVEQVAEDAYEKACEAVSDTMAEQTRAEDIEELRRYKKWLTSDERKTPKDKRDFVGRCLDNLENRLRGMAQKVAGKVMETLQNPRIKEQKKSEVKEHARKSVRALLEANRKLVEEQRAKVAETPAHKKARGEELG